MSIFGAIKIADDLEQAALDTLQSWFKTYLREYELQAGEPQDAYPLPRSYLTADRLDREGSEQMPAIVVVSPGFGGTQPKQEGDGSFRVFFSLGVGVFVAGKDRPSTKKLVRVYTAIARTIMLQKQSLGGFADGTRWLDESYDDNFNFTDQQTIGAGQAIFEVEVAGIVSRYGGPAYPTAPDPDTQPGSDWPQVQSATATIVTKE